MTAKLLYHFDLRAFQGPWPFFFPAGRLVLGLQGVTVTLEMSGDPSARVSSPAMRAGVAVVLLTLLAPSTLHAQVEPDDLRAALAQIRNDAIRWQAGEGGFPPLPAQQQIWERVRVAADWLLKRVNTTNPADVTPEYLRALQRAAEFVRTGSPDYSEDVASELEAKVDHCRKLGIGMGGTVTLRVNTLRSGKPVPNLRVQALLKIHERDERAAPLISDRVSSPADVTLAPGRYWLWSLDEATGARSERVLKTVSGQKELLFDLIIP